MRKSDIYDLDDALEALQTKEMMLDMAIRQEIILELLKKHNITNDIEMQACEQYVRTLPYIKASLDIVERQRQAIAIYKADPQKHLQDIFKAKLNGIL